MALCDFWSADDPPASPVAQNFKKTVSVSPSPRGECRDEGGRETTLNFLKFFSCQHSGKVVFS